ncbi:MAG: hypothetical protein V1848_01275 [Candidatus Magasanikbacteria bacterium]
MRFFVTSQYSRIYKQIMVIIASVMIIVGGIPHTVIAEDSGVYPSEEVITIVEESLNFPVSEDRGPRYTVWVLATGYSLEKAQTDSTPCIPANGENLCVMRETQGYHNTIAANFLAFGKRIRLPDYFNDKDFIVRDRMNERYNGQMRIDIVFDTRAEAKAWGARWVKMEVY